MNEKETTNIPQHVQVDQVKWTQKANGQKKGHGALHVQLME